nr:MAG: hypothetical protein [Helarchaeota virus Nidhogg Meg22_1012]
MAEFGLNNMMIRIYIKYLVSERYINFKSRVISNLELDDYDKIIYVCNYEW